jgi:hypothetical protein
VESGLDAPGNEFWRENTLLWDSAVIFFFCILVFFKSFTYRRPRETIAEMDPKHSAKNLGTVGTRHGAKRCGAVLCHVRSPVVRDKFG